MHLNRLSLHKRSFHRTTRLLSKITEANIANIHLTRINNLLKATMTCILLYGFSHIYIQNQVNNEEN